MTVTLKMDNLPPGMPPGNYYLLLMLVLLLLVVSTVQTTYQLWRQTWFRRGLGSEDRWREGRDISAKLESILGYYGGLSGICCE